MAAYEITLLALCLLLTVSQANSVSPFSFRQTIPSFRHPCDSQLPAVGHESHFFTSFLFFSFCLLFCYSVKSRHEKRAVRVSEDVQVVGGLILPERHTHVPRAERLRYAPSHTVPSYEQRMRAMNSGFLQNLRVPAAATTSANKQAIV